MSADWPVTYRRKIRFSDSDAQGIVFNANYLVYVDDTWTDFFESAGLPWADMVAQGFEVVLARTEIDYKEGAMIGETVEVGLRVASIGNTSIGLEFRIWDAADPTRTFVEGKQIQVVVDAEHFEPAPVPAFLRSAVATLQPDALF